MLPLAQRFGMGELVCGPLGHLYGGLADWAVLAGRLTAAKARARLAEPRRSS